MKVVREMSTWTVVVPLDGSDYAEQVIPYAEAARGESGELIFLEVVFPSGPERDLLGDIELSIEEVLERKRDAALDRLRDTANRWSEVLKQSPRIEALAGDPAEAILKFAEREGADIIAMASYGRGAITRLAFGSVADQITRASPLPVMIAHPRWESSDPPMPARIQKVVVPLDGSAMSREALPLASRLAREIGGQLLLVQVMNPALSFSVFGDSVSPFSLGHYDETAQRMRDDALNVLEDARESVTEDGLRVETEVLEGSPVDRLREAIQPGDLVVMTSHGRSGFRRWLLGSTAEKLIRSGEAPVVLVPVRAKVEAMAST